MKPITEQHIWDLLDGNCSFEQAQYLQQQLRLEENTEWFQLYQQLQLLNNDLKNSTPIAPSANFNAAVLAKLEVAKNSKVQTVSPSNKLALWNPISKVTLVAIFAFTVLTLFLQYIIPSPETTSMGWGMAIIDGIVQMARNPIFVSSICLIYMLGLLTLLDGFLKKRFQNVRLSKR